MKLPVQKCVAGFAVWLTLFTPLNVGVAYAQDHIVGLAELEGQLQTRSAQRAVNIADLQRVLSHPAAQDLLGKAKVSPDQLNRAIATLSPDELSRLGEQARSAERDVQGGLIIGILALIGLVVVILIVIAVVND